LSLVPFLKSLVSSQRFVSSFGVALLNFSTDNRLGAHKNPLFEKSEIFFFK
jgi:hypothetical protein